MVRRSAWYRFTFEDGWYVIEKGLSPVTAYEYIQEHGKIINKEFVRWE